MTLPTLLALRPTRRPGRQPRSGFALIISLSLMTLLLLLVLTLSILVRLELQTAQGNLYTEQARQNALLGAYIAIGQLQKFAGPDQRITTTADIGRQRVLADATTAQVVPDNARIGMTFPYVLSVDEGATANVTIPYGQSTWDSAGTLYWTVVWGHGTNPLSIYTGNDTNGKASPSPILLNYLVSGDEATPLSFSANGVVTAPDQIYFTAATGNNRPGVGILRTSDPNDPPTNWTGLTNDIVMKPNAGPTTDYAPAALLVGPVTAATNTTTRINIYPGNDRTKFSSIIKELHPGSNQVIVPMVNINVPDEGSATRTVGRYAYWVGDEGVKAKYNIPDSLAGVDKQTSNITATTVQGQTSRYRFDVPHRNGIERMTIGLLKQMDTYAANVNNPNTYDKQTATLLGQVLDQSQVLLLDRNLVGVDHADKPAESLRLHFHDYTTYSYGVLSDSLRGGLRYDLTSVFEPGPGSDLLFRDTTNGLAGKAILPPNISATASVTTEPMAASGGYRNRSDSSQFHGPAAPDLSNTSRPGLKWDALQSWYRISSNNTTGAPITVVAGNSTVAGISPVILQARLKFSETVDKDQFQYVAVEPIFVLANPYNFPITPPAGGLDLGFRMNTNTGWEWGFHAVARNSDRAGTTHSNGAGVYIGYDATQGNNTGLNAPGAAAMLNYTQGGVASNAVLTSGYGGLFYSSTAVSQITPNSTTNIQYAGGSNGIGVRPGYYPFLKNPASYPLFISSMPGSAGQQGNSRFDSVLDQVAFHIPKTVNGVTVVWQPGEAIVFTLADETNGGRNLTSQFQPISKYNQLSTTARKITAVVGTLGSTGSQYSIGASQVVPVMLAPGKLNADTSHYFMLRYTGIKTAGDTLLSYFNSNGSAVDPNWALRGNPANTTAYGNDDQNTWPDPTFGYISTPWPSVAATLELRYDNITVTPTYASDFGTIPINANGGTVTAPVPINSGNYTNGIYTGTISLPGTNVLQTITNFDLSGAGLPSHTYVPGAGDPAAYVPPNPRQGYRRQFLGSGGGVTTPSTSNGVLPVFLVSYVMAMALPGSMDPMYFAKDLDTGSGDSGNTTFDPNMQVSYRTFMDFNVRAVNLSLPPTAPLNRATTNTTLTVNTTAFITSPPYGRIWNQGPNIGGGAGDNNVAASFNLFDEQSFNAKNIGPNFSTFNVTGTNRYDSPWGNSLSTVTSANASAGQQYNILFALPTRANAGTSGSTANIPNPNDTVNTVLPDIPIMSLGQLQHADMTADDVWVSVGYQRGNAIGNSYWTPFVNRNSSMSTRPVLSGNATRRITSVVGNTTNFANITAASGNIGVYDISYLLNCALFDRYFFSTLAQAQRTTTMPANSRLKYAAGIIPSVENLGLGGSATTVTDPVTGGTMFRAYAAARYLMIDGAFNVNSTSFEAWRAVLSGMRNVALSTAYGGSADATGRPTPTGSQGQYPVVYTPRALASGFVANATAGTTPVSMTSANIYQPLKAGPTFNQNPNSGDSTAKDAASYAGFRQLTDADIDILAMKIVQQVHARGPFLSLAQFVNRRLTLPTPNHSLSYSDPLSWSGALQTAIDVNYFGSGGWGTKSNSLNNFYLAMVNSTGTSPMGINPNLLPADSQGGANSNQTYPEGKNAFLFQSPYPSGSADPNSRLVGIPGWLTQADLLESLTPILAVRSDTFIIRTYGEVLNPQTNQQDLVNAIAKDPTKILSRAWCEVVVQRVPDYIATDTASLNEPSATTGLNAPNPSIGGKVSPILKPVNIAFGRRFKIVSVRWLNANDI